MERMMKYTTDQLQAKIKKGTLYLGGNQITDVSMIVTTCRVYR
jgi:hypothetical protein